MLTRRRAAAALKWFAIVASLVLACGASAALARDEDDFLLRIGADVAVAPGETVDTLVVIDGNLVVDGTARTVVVIDGDVTVNGTVEDDLVVLNGSVHLAEGSRVHDLRTYKSDVTRSEDATVTGDFDRDDDIDIGISGPIADLFSLVFWLVLTIAIVVSGLLFAMTGTHLPGLRGQRRDEVPRVVSTA
jgi:hypothetical protein